MPVKIGLVINRGGQLNQVQRQNVLTKKVENKLSTPAPAPPALTTNTPPGINLRRVMNAPKTGCKSCGS